MGLFGNWSLSELYSKAKDTISSVYGAVKSGTGMLKQAKDFVSETVNKLSAIPYVGGLIFEGVQKIEEEPILFGLSFNDVGRGIDRLSEITNSGQVDYYAGLADQFFSGAARGADQLLSQAG